MSQSNYSKLILNSYKDSSHGGQVARMIKQGKSAILSIGNDNSLECCVFTSKAKLPYKYEGFRGDITAPVLTKLPKVYLEPIITYHLDKAIHEASLKELVSDYVLKAK